MKRTVITPDNLPKNGVIEADCPVSLYGLAGKTISVTINLGHRDTERHTQALQDDQCNGMVIERLIIRGRPDESSKSRWMETDYMGAMINSPGAIISHLYAEKVHIPLKLIGEGATCEYLHTLDTSGDGFQLCGDFTHLERADIHGLLDVYPYHMDHSDVGMLFPVRGKTTLHCARVERVKLHKQGHRWEHTSPQGILAPDNTCIDCHVAYCDLLGVHAEHGVRFGHAEACTVSHVKTNGAIAFGDRKSHKKGKNNNVSYCESPRIVFEDDSQSLREKGKGMSRTTIDRSVFYDAVRDSLFRGSLSQTQVDGMNAIFDAWDQFGPDEPGEFKAYSFATAYHETGTTMEAVKERGGESYHRRMYDITGDRPDKAKRNGNCVPGDGAKYCGHGLPQLTWKDNYKRQGEKHNLDLINHPELMLDINISARVMISGMIDGDFTGRSLNDYYHNQSFDSLGARRIINGSDCDKLIEGYYIKFLDALDQALVSAPPVPDYDELRGAPNVNIRQPEEMANYYDQKIDGPITPEPDFESVKNEKSTISQFFSGKKTHFGMLITGIMGIAAMFGYIPGITPEAGAGMLQNAFAISGTRSAIPKLIIMGIKYYAGTRAR